MKREHLTAVFTFLFDQSWASLEADQLLVCTPVVVHAGTQDELDKAIDAELERAAGVLEKALGLVQARLLESWISDDAGEPTTLAEAMPRLALGVPIQLEAHWQFESAVGFPEDEPWLTGATRQLLAASPR